MATGTIGLPGVVAGDDLGASGSYLFDSRNVGVRTVAASGIALSGADAGNYTVNTSATGTAEILAKAITASVLAGGKTYDGTALANGGLVLNGVIGNDDVTGAGSYVFADKNAGKGKIVTASGVALSGADAGNYTVTASATAFADILRRIVTVTANDVIKFPGQDDPALTCRISGGSLVGDDSFTGALHASWAIGRAAMRSGRAVSRFPTTMRCRWCPHA